MTRAIHPVGSMGATIETALAESKPIWWQTPPRLDLAASAVVSAFAEEAKQLMANTASGESPAPLSPEHEAEIRERIDRLNDDRVLTGSTWLASSVGSKSVFPPEQSHVVEDVAETTHSVIRGSVGVFGNKQHAEFTAQAPDDIAALLDEIDRLRAERQETNSKLVELTVALRAAEKRIAELEPEPDQQRSALEAIWQRWFVNAQQGVSFREFTEGIGGDLRAAIEGGGR